MIRRIRLISGVVLFVYVTTHLLNHALGLVSLKAMEDGREWFLVLWRNPAGTLALYGALVVHFGLALWAIHERRRLRCNSAELIQLLFGFSIPLLLALHVIATRAAHALFETNDTYVYVLLAHFRYSPEQVYWQSAALLVAWSHGCIGIHRWLCLKPFYPRIARFLFAVALLLPVLALLGYVAGGRAVLALAADPEWLRAARLAIRLPGNDETRRLLGLVEAARWIVVAGVALALAGRVVRHAIERSRGVLRIGFPDGRTVTVPPGTSVLDASRRGGIPHAEVCGGRGRCSTCRVRVIAGADALPPPAAEEQRVLDRIGAPPLVRLACQLRPTENVGVLPLLPPSAQATDGFPRPAWRSGQEREIVILFADLRDFTGFSERKLPYDVVFVLNRYFAAMGEAVIESGGHLDKFIGDGVMALFGIGASPETGARQALAAARAMAINLDGINRALAHDLDSPLRIGIGLHAGAAIIGEMGYGQATSLTAVGDTVNTASRIEAATKEYGAQLVLSDEVARRAGVDLSAFPGHELTVRGRSEPILVRVVVDARDLPVETGGGKLS